MGKLSEETRRAFVLVFIGAFGYTCLMFIWFSLPAYLPTIITELELTSTQAGVLVGAVPLTYIPFALFSGLAVDRVGPGRSLTVGILIYGFAQIGRSVAPTFLSLLALTLLIGVGATTITFGLPKLVSVLFPPDRTGLPSAIYLIGASVGSAAVFGVGRPVFGPLLGGWRPLFFWSGIVAVIYACCWLVVAWQAQIDNRIATQPSAFSIDAIRHDLTLILSHRELQLIVVVGTMYLFVNHGVQGWLPTVLESRGLTPDHAGQTTSVFIAAFAIGVFTVPAIADRYAARRLAVITCGGFIFLGIGGVVAGEIGFLTIVGVVLAGVGVGGVSPLIRAMPPELDGIGVRLTGTAVGFIFTVGEIGGFLGPVLIGRLHGATGSFLPGLVILAGAGLIIVLVGIKL